MGKAKTGTGLMVYFSNYDKKMISTDYSGNTSSLEIDGARDERSKEKADKPNCYRNDASLFFHVAAGYRVAFLLLGERIKELFDNQAKEKVIQSLVFPYFFNFRHALELYLKGLIVSVTDDFPKTVHGLSSFTDSLEFRIKQLAWNESTYVSYDTFMDKKEELIAVYRELKKDVYDYCQLEPSDEYYRYLFEKSEDSLSLKHSVVSFDYNRVSVLFSRIDEKVFQICHLLKEMDIYVNPYL